MTAAARSTPARAPLPPARGPVSDCLFEALRRRPHHLGRVPECRTTTEDDRQLSLYCCYELHYTGFDGVDDRWEWEPSLLRVRAALERDVEDEMRAAVGPIQTHPEAVVDQLWQLGKGGDGPSLSKWMSQCGTVWHLRELAIHRSAYQLKEADPHSWAIPRLAGAAKAAMVAIQADEYGHGDPEAVHAVLFGHTLDALGVERGPNAHLPALPGVTLATTNLISLFGLHRRLRGALVGHLALFEMTSVGPIARYAAVLEGLGLPAAARRFYEVHVEADAVHQHVAADQMVGGLLRDDPGLASDVVFGARALGIAEARFARYLLDSWGAGRSSLLADCAAA